MSDPIPRTVAGLQAAIRRGALGPAQVMASAIDRIAVYDDPAIWISTVDPDRLRAEADAAVEGGPLRGVPFAVKDNIDVAGTATTAGCPDFAYEPTASARAVQRLSVAGSIAVGKTNLDQFATGLVGTRSPYGTPRNPFDPSVVPGGSSSGSAVAVSAGLVPFALGTDTAGSGRVPAAFGNIVGCKPTPGLISTTGVVPACRSLDCVSIFTLTAADAAIVLAVLDQADPDDVYSRPVDRRRQRSLAVPTEVVVGVPYDSVIERCDLEVAEAFDLQLKELGRLGVQLIPVDVSPFLAVGELLYGGPWLAERDAAIGTFLDTHPDAVHPVPRDIILGSRGVTAREAFVAEYHRRELARQAAEAWVGIDALVMPTVPMIPTVAMVEADPVGVNARLGMFSTFVNLLDLCAVAAPGGFLATGVPVGFTLVAPPCSDLFLLDLVDRYQRMVDRPLGGIDFRIDSEPAPVIESAGPTVPLAVVGAHLSGQPLNHQLVERGSTLAARTRTSASYRLVALADAVPPKPGLVRVADGGASIDVEVWDVPVGQLGSFVQGVPAPLAIGKVELTDGSWVSGFVCEPRGMAGAVDITQFGGWRAYLASL